MPEKLRTSPNSLKETETLSFQRELTALKASTVDEIRSYWNPYYKLAEAMSNNSKVTEKIILETGGQIREDASVQDVKEAFEQGANSAHLNFDGTFGFEARELQRVVCFSGSE